MKRIARLAVPVLIIVLGVVAARVLVATKPKPKRAPKSERVALVEVEQFTPHSAQTVVTANGQVIPSKRVVLTPQVGGKVIWTNEQLIPGGHVKKGATLVRIDPRDYHVAVQQREAELNRARLELEVERSRQSVAQREWEIFARTDNGAGTPTPDTAGKADAGGEEDLGSLALREPQLRTAQVQVKAARSATERAQLELNRTTLTAPFDAVVQMESVDVGQVVGPSSQIATLLDTSAFWVQVSIPIERLTQIAIPGVNATEGDAVKVVQDVGDTSIVREGRVLRLLGDLDPVGGMARLLVEIRDPLGLGAEEPGLPMLVGAFVRVEIQGRTLDGVYEIPRSALREGDRLFVMNEDDKLEIRDIKIAWGRAHSVLVRNGINERDRVIVSRVATPVEGTALRVLEAKTDVTKRAEADAPETPPSTPAGTPERNSRRQEVQ